MAFKDLNLWIKGFPLLDEIIKLRPVTWINPQKKKMSTITSLPVNRFDMEEAEKLCLESVTHAQRLDPDNARTYIANALYHLFFGFG